MAIESRGVDTAGTPPNPVSLGSDLSDALTAIWGLAELVLFEAPGDVPSRQDVLAIRSAAERAAGLARQLQSGGRKETAAAWAAPQRLTQ